MPVPEDYYQFVMDNAPYLYVVPQSGPDMTWGKAALAAGFAVDFLYEAYFDPQFDDRSSEIEAKIIELADWIVSQQVTDTQFAAYGGFRSTENSTTCYSVDVARTVPALLKAYELTSNVTYFNSAKLAAGTFLYNMQHQPSALGLHDRYYGGFVRCVDTQDAWQQQMDIEALENLYALGMLSEVDPANRNIYQTIIQDAVNFYRPGLEGLNLYFDPLPSGDGVWHRTGLGDDTVFDDSIAYALFGLYSYEGYSNTVKNVYQAITVIGASPQYPAYNPAVCWAGYLNVAAKMVACDYYDAVAAGILGQIRKKHDSIAYDFSVKVIGAHAGEFMFWGPRQTDFIPIEDKQAMATVCWVGQMLIGYEHTLTRFTQILGSKGEDLQLYPVTQTGESTGYGSAIDIKAIVLPGKAQEILIEPGYIISDYMVLHAFTPLRRLDKICRDGVYFEVTEIQDFAFKGQTAFRKATCRRLQY